MSPNDGTPFKLRATLVDGIPSRTGIDPFGTYSERIRILFDHEHDELGREFQTKRFMIRNEEPGICHWGGRGQSSPSKSSLMTIEQPPTSDRKWIVFATIESMNVGEKLR